MSTTILSTIFALPVQHPHSVARNVPNSSALLYLIFPVKIKDAKWRFWSSMNWPLGWYSWVFSWNIQFLFYAVPFTCPFGFEQVPGEKKCLFFSPPDMTMTSEEALGYCKSITNSEGTLVEIRDEGTLNFITERTSGMFLEYASLQTSISIYLLLSICKPFLPLIFAFLCIINFLIRAKFDLSKEKNLNNIGLGLVVEWFG